MRSLALRARCQIVRAFGTHCQTAQAEDGLRYEIARLEDSPRCQIYPELAEGLQAVSLRLLSDSEGLLSPERSRSEAYAPNDLTASLKGERSPSHFQFSPLPLTFAPLIFPS